jgi:hypothetical protein
MTQYENEVELAPGIYLTKMKPSSSSSANPQTVSSKGLEMNREAEKKQQEFLEQHPKEHYEWIKAQIHRIQNALSKLEYSNKEMLEVDPTDQDFLDAVKENLEIMEKQRQMVENYKKQAKELASTLGLCFQEMEEKAFVKTAGQYQDDLDVEGEGVYL